MSGIQSANDERIRMSSYRIRRHDHVISQTGYVEVLEVMNPADGHTGIVINEFNTGSTCSYTEWRTLSEAMSVFNDSFLFAKLLLDENSPDLKHKVCREEYENCSLPWFYE